MLFAPHPPVAAALGAASLPPALTGAGGRALLVVIGLAVASAAYVMWQHWRRQFRATSRRPEATGRSSVLRIDGYGTLGARATFVQFSTPTCTTCPRVATVLRTIAEQTDGVSHVEIDATTELDLVRQFDIRTAPTVFVLDPAGHPVARASGPIGRDQARAALATVSATVSAPGLASPTLVPAQELS